MTHPETTLTPLRRKLEGGCTRTDIRQALIATLAYLEAQAAAQPVAEARPIQPSAPWLRASDGTELEPGTYEVLEIHTRDDAPALNRGERFTISSPERARYGYWQVVTYDDDAKRGENTWVSVARRVDVHSAPASPPVENYDEQAFARDLDAVFAQLRTFLIEKNKAYGDSVLSPVQILSSANPREQILNRIDDKLKRHLKGEPAGEDVAADIRGYFILLGIYDLRHGKKASPPTEDKPKSAITEMREMQGQGDATEEPRGYPPPDFSEAYVSGLEKDLVEAQAELTKWKASSQRNHDDCVKAEAELTRVKEENARLDLLNSDLRCKWVTLDRHNEVLKLHEDAEGRAEAGKRQCSRIAHEALAVGAKLAEADKMIAGLTEQLRARNAALDAAAGTLRANEAELRKRDAVVGAARNVYQVSRYWGPAIAPSVILANLRKTLSALDQPSQLEPTSERECP